MKENKMGKYFKYAIGEILLVVIGILIALQINNWNESNKLKSEEIKLLKEFRKDVEFSITELDTVGYYNEVSVEYIKSIQNHLFNDLPYSEVLDTAFGQLDIWSIPYLPLATYETIKTRGIDRISNDRLKKKINQVYEFGMKYLLEDSGAWEWSFNQNTTQSMMINHIRRNSDIDIGNETAKPNNYEALKENEEFGNFINVLVQVRNSHAKALRDMSEQMEQLFILLNEELAPYD